MKPTVYLETTIIGYLAMRPSRDLRIAANQQLTREWWDNHRHKYETVISRFVSDECRAGDPTAVQERLVYLQGLSFIEITDEVELLAETLISRVALPSKAAVDAYHISVSAINGIEYLVTWNCRHIANPALRPKIERICREMGHEPPSICTPQELMEINDEF